MPTKWWVCVNMECPQFERVASSDQQPLCPGCQTQMRNLDNLDPENVPDQVNEAMATYVEEPDA